MGGLWSPLYLCLSLLQAASGAQLYSQVKATIESDHLADICTMCDSLPSSSARHLLTQRRHRRSHQSDANSLSALSTVVEEMEVEAQTEARAKLDAINGTLRVGLALVPPFCMPKANGVGYDGFATDLWERVAKDTHQVCTYVTGTQSELWKRLVAGEIDVIGSGKYQTLGLGQAEKIQFTQAFWFSGLNLLVETRPHLSSYNLAFFTEVLKHVLTLLVSMIGAMFVVSVVFYFLECDVNDALKFNQPKVDDGRFDDDDDDDEDDGGCGETLQGIFASMYLSVVTWSTVGYGDISPRTRGGKCVMLLWMVWSLFLLAYFTGEITTSLTAPSVSNSVISSISDLAMSDQVAVVQGSFAHRASKVIAVKSNFHPQFVPYGDYRAAVDALLAGKVQAVYGVAETLKWLAKDDSRIRDVGFPSNYHSMVFPFSPTSPRELVQAVSQTMLDVEVIRLLGDVLVDKYMVKHS